MEEVLTPERIVVPKQFAITELWLELQSQCGSAPSRTQFYEWLKLAYIVEPQPRGGIKQQQTYTEGDLRRLIKFYDLRTQLGSLRSAQEALKAEINNNPTFYGA